MNEDLVIWREEMNKCMISTMKNVSKLTDGMVTLSKDVDELRKTLTKRVYLSNSHLIAVKKAVCSKTSEICKISGFDYKKAYRYIIQAIYKSVNGQYNVPSYRELPEAFYDEIIEAINGWNLPSYLVEKIKAA